MRLAGDVYEDVASENLDELREEIPSRDIELKKMDIETRGV